VSTPSNAIVYGTGMVPLIKMVRYGIILDIIGAVVIIAAMATLVPILR
jgi:sodium-dependent dicarboxylate transporter 2/3/5